jgi:hypothetical protein
LIRIKAQVARAVLFWCPLPTEINMPTETIVVLSFIVFCYAAFMVTLAWVSWRTNRG